MKRLAISAALASALGISVNGAESASAQATLAPAVYKLVKESELNKAVYYALEMTKLWNEPNYETMDTRSEGLLGKGLLKKHQVTLQPTKYDGVVSFKMTVNKLDGTDCLSLAALMTVKPGPVLDFAVNGVADGQNSGKACKTGFRSRNKMEIVGR